MRLMCTSYACLWTIFQSRRDGEYRFCRDNFVATSFRNRPTISSRRLSKIKNVNMRKICSDDAQLRFCRNQSSFDYKTLELKLVSVYYFTTLIRTQCSLDLSNSNENKLQQQNRNIQSRHTRSHRYTDRSISYICVLGWT